MTTGKTRIIGPDFNLLPLTDRHTFQFSRLGGLTSSWTAEKRLLLVTAGNLISLTVRECTGVVTIIVVASISRTKNNY